MALPKNSAINTRPAHKAIIYCVAFWLCRFAAGMDAFFFIFSVFIFSFRKYFISASEIKN